MILLIINTTIINRGLIHLVLAALQHERRRGPHVCVSQDVEPHLRCIEIWNSRDFEQQINISNSILTLKCTIPLNIPAEIGSPHRARRSALQNNQGIFFVIIYFPLEQGISCKARFTDEAKEIPKGKSITRVARRVAGGKPYRSPPEARAGSSSRSTILHYIV